MRSLTFNALEPSTTEVVLYTCFTVVSVFLFTKSLHFGCTRPHFADSRVLSLFFPLSIAFIIYENVVMALGKHVDVDNFASKALLLTHPAVVPCLLLTSFEITYLVHKRRSVKFCGIQFDEGRRIKTTFTSWLLRNFFNLICIVLLVIGTIVDFDLLSLDKIDDAAGRVGWFDLLNFDGDWEMQTHRMLALLPTAMLVFANLYFAIMMWRYGTQSSMIVHSSYCNPWMSQFVGTLFLAGGQAFNEKWFSVMSNMGEVAMVFMTLGLLQLVDTDMNEARKFDDFLGIVGGKTTTKNELAQIEAAMAGLQGKGGASRPPSTNGHGVTITLPVGVGSDSPASSKGAASFNSGLTPPGSSYGSGSTGLRISDEGEEGEEDAGVFKNIWQSIFPPSPPAPAQEVAFGSSGSGVGTSTAVVELSDVAVRL